jgi:hypothetical protein
MSRASTFAEVMCEREWRIMRSERRIGNNTRRTRQQGRYSVFSLAHCVLMFSDQRRLSHPKSCQRVKQFNEDKVSFINLDKRIG